MGKVKKKYQTFCKAWNINRINDLLLHGRFLTASQFEEKYETVPPVGLLQHVTQLIPQAWLDSLSSVDMSIPPDTFFLKNVKGEVVNLHSLSTKQIYLLFEHRKPSGYTCAQRWNRAYEGDSTFDSPMKWEAWSLLPY